MTDFFVGLDLGQVQDFTAIAVVGLDERYLKALRTREEAYERLGQTSERFYYDEIDLRVESRQIEERLGPMPQPVYEVRHLERLPLGTPYTEVAWHVWKLLDTPPLQSKARLVVDKTGVGVGVTDLLRARGLCFEGVTITGGEKESRDGGDYRVPKKDLIAWAQILLEEGNRRLKIAASLPEARTLVEELLHYRYRISEAGNDMYEPWREGQHDDLVLALCLALWAAERRSASPMAPLPLDTSYLPFKPLKEMPFPSLKFPPFGAWSW